LCNFAQIAIIKNAANKDEAMTRVVLVSKSIHGPPKNQLKASVIKAIMKL